MSKESRRLIDVTEDDLLVGIKKILMGAEKVDLSSKPAVTKAYAAKWLRVAPPTIYNWIENKTIKVDANGLIPFSELIRLDKAA